MKSIWMRTRKTDLGRGGSRKCLPKRESLRSKTKVESTMRDLLNFSSTSACHGVNFWTLKHSYSSSMECFSILPKGSTLMCLSLRSSLRSRCFRLSLSITCLHTEPLVRRGSQKGRLTANGTRWTLGGLMWSCLMWRRTCKMHSVTRARTGSLTYGWTCLPKSSTISSMLTSTKWIKTL